MGKLGNEKDKYPEINPNFTQLKLFGCQLYWQKGVSLPAVKRGRMIVTFQCVSLLVFVQGLTVSCYLSNSL